MESRGYPTRAPSCPPRSTLVTLLQRACTAKEMGMTMTLQTWRQLPPGQLLSITSHIAPRWFDLIRARRPDKQQ
ncbi:hypothetical protein GOP47_0016541 [Adiantum capillus-veneris]|uniref:Uncharacterized protein n=1 Tax=Adiantum capillus-veneris TaxID=13818 RepID=A0A9D4UHV5_ADICA|nr:hypothetical protein GOP47_0016541 [Adiantum capillus-veneris]